MYIIPLVKDLVKFEKLISEVRVREDLGAGKIAA